MNSLFDVLELLKRYGTYIYTGDQRTDLDLMEDELKELYSMEFITPKEYATARLIITQRRNKLGNR